MPFPASGNPRQSVATLARTRRVLSTDTSNKNKLSRKRLIIFGDPAGARNVSLSPSLFCYQFFPKQGLNRPLLMSFNGRFKANIKGYFRTHVPDFLTARQIVLDLPVDFFLVDCVRKHRFVLPLDFSKAIKGLLSILILAYFSFNVNLICAFMVILKC